MARPFVESSLKSEFNAFLFAPIGKNSDGMQVSVLSGLARVSLANRTEVEYAAIGKFTRQILDECHQDFKKTIVLQ